MFTFNLRHWADRARWLIFFKRVETTNHLKTTSGFVSATSEFLKATPKSGDHKGPRCSSPEVWPQDDLVCLVGRSQRVSPGESHGGPGWFGSSHPWAVDVTGAPHPNFLNPPIWHPNL